MRARTCHLLLLAVAAAAACAAAADESSAWVSQDGGASCPGAPPGTACRRFVDALSDPAVASILLTTDVRLSASDFPDPPSLLPLERDLSIRPAPGGGGGALRAIDFAFLKEKVMIGQNITVEFDRIRLERTRARIDPSIDLFLGRPGAAVAVRDGVEYRPLALPPQSTLDIATSYPRPDRFPGPAQAVRVLAPSGCAPGAPADMIYDDGAFRLGGPETDLPGGPLGYDLLLVNVSRLCDGVVPEGCVRSHTAEWCLEAAAAGADAGGGGGGGLSPGAAAGAAVGALAGAAALGAAGVVALRLRGRRARAAAHAAARAAHAARADATPLADVRPRLEGAGAGGGKRALQSGDSLV
ncbi:hypothetical protein Rsub_04515 [Raphidocelis subcapitata]|uniref:Uncharacterized protein n=1 Tax=Raphidocelis subcapitata TaxID=307507 RepID=A0A2V0NX00_9CHLO|nr:hypothetical protein Rsub_04515 [Raphidocelis subcapitata]|eukprot:GBF92168.1 hypothetical protein Rsub_04515 [Raphidocelis subcapitata]